MCHALRTRLRQPAEEAVHEAALVEVLLQLRLVVLPAAHRAEHLEDAEQDHEVEDAEDPQEHAGHRRADHAGDVVQRRVAVLDLTGEGADAERPAARQAEHDRRVAQGEPEADRQRLADLVRGRAAGFPGGVVGQQLAGGVVHCGDVVGVEGVAQAEGVGQQADAGGEDGVAAAEVVVAGHDEREQDAEADDVQRDDEGGHAAQRPAVACGQALPEPSERGELNRICAGHGAGQSGPPVRSGACPRRDREVVSAPYRNLVAIRVDCGMHPALPCRCPRPYSWHGLRPRSRRGNPRRAGRRARCHREAHVRRPGLPGRHEDGRRRRAAAAA